MIIFEKIGLEIINGQISGYILNFYLKPDREKCFLYTDLIKRAEVYSSPLRRSIDPLITFTRDKRNHKIEISLIKMHIIVINKYFEELLAFKNEISSKFSDLQAQIISKARIKKNDGITEVV